MSQSCRSQPIVSTCTVLTLLLPAVGLAEEGIDEVHASEMPTIVVQSRRVANDEPASASASIATALRYDRQIDLQSRGLAEAQADISVRGGLFENTGVNVGAVTVLDPQTGHYSAQLPVDPNALSSVHLLTGTDNALSGFNATVATLQYAWRPLTTRRQLGLGVGTDAFRYRSLNLAQVFNVSGHSSGIEMSYSGSDGDGTRANGDHDFEQAFLRAQYRSTRTQTDFAVGFQDNFYAWPGAYTGFPSLAETDHTKTALVLFNQRIGEIQDLGHSYLEWGGYYRDLEDDYDFDRTTAESGVPGAFDHRTRSYAIGAKGLQPLGDWQWHYRVQLTGDELVRSTDLTNGQFTSRRYARLGLMPSRRWSVSAQTELTLRFGASFDASNRDSNAWLPTAGLSWLRSGDTGTDRVSFDYAETSQLPGYTALNSAANGLFGGNPLLGRERAKTLALSVERQRQRWNVSVTVFARRDDNLVDWTFQSGAPFARQANAVDVDVLGVESMLSRQWQAVEMTAGYSYLDKQADYGASAVDASFYALNYARHRLTAALWLRPTDHINLRWDNELRRQVDNPLRNGDRNAYVTSVALEWSPASISSLTVHLIADNLSNSNFEEFPGTPSARRQWGVKLHYHW